MKKILFYSLLLLSVTLSAQNYTLLNQETNAYINNGDVITVSTSGETTHVIFTNTSNVPQKATIEVVDIVNTDGSEMTMCFGFHGNGNCYGWISNHTTYHSNVNGTDYLLPGESTAPADIDFMHTDNSTAHPNYPKDYIFKLTVYNANDDTVLGETNFTYRYDPNGSGAVNTFDKNEVVISTGHKVLNIVSDVTLKVYIYNLTGQKVKEMTLSPQQNHIYTGDMTQGIYIVRVQSGNKELYKKVILK